MSTRGADLLIRRGLLRPDSARLLRQAADACRGDKEMMLLWLANVAGEAMAGVSPGFVRAMPKSGPARLRFDDHDPAQ